MTTTAKKAKPTATNSIPAKVSTTTERSSRPAAKQTENEKDSVLMAYAKAFYGEAIPPSNTGSDICKMQKGTDNDKTYVWYMTDDVCRVIELKALEESSKLKHLVGAERSAIYSVNVGNTFIKEINLDEAEQLLEEFPDIPREKTLEDYLSSLDDKFQELNISSIISSETLHFGKDKLIRLGAVKVSQWLDLVIDEVHLFYKREHFTETVESHHEDLNIFYEKLKPLMKELGLKDKYYDLSFKEMMIHKIEGLDFVVSDLMPKLLKLEASKKDDEARTKAILERNPESEGKTEIKCENCNQGFYDKLVSKIFKTGVCAIALTFFAFFLVNFIKYSI